MGIRLGALVNAGVCLGLLTGCTVIPKRSVESTQVVRDSDVPRDVGESHGLPLGRKAYERFASDSGQGSWEPIPYYFGSAGSSSRSYGDPSSGARRVRC